MKSGVQVLSTLSLEDIWVSMRVIGHVSSFLKKSFFWILTASRSINSYKTEKAWSIKDLLYGITSPIFLHSG